MYQILIAHIALGLLHGRRVGAPLAWQICGCLLFARLLAKYQFFYCGYGTDRSCAQSAALLLSGIFVAAGQFLPKNWSRQRMLEISALLAYYAAWAIMGMDFLTLLVSWIVGRQIYNIFPRYATTGMIISDKNDTVFFKAVGALMVFFVWLVLKSTGIFLAFNLYDLIRLQ